MGESRRRTLEDCTGPRDRGPKWRAPLRRPVRLHHLLSQDFFEAVTENISEGGMLVQSTMTLPIGAGVSFRITLSDGDAVIQGFGRVIWLNHDEDGASNGIGIRFVYLSGTSSKLVHRIVVEHCGDGVSAFDLDARG